jgi:peptide deformylase
MVLMKLRLHPAECLIAPCVPVTFPSGEISRYGREVQAFARRCNGYALAANQVGLTGAWFVFSRHETCARAPWLMANPVIISTRGEFTFNESCLSLPGLHYPLKRFDVVTVRYQNEFGDTKEFTAEKLLGRIIQHELDHLAGKLFTAHLSGPDREDADSQMAGRGATLTKESERPVSSAIGSLGRSTEDDGEEAIVNGLPVPK